MTISATAFFGAAVGIDGRAAIGGVLDVGVFQKVILFIISGASPRIKSRARLLSSIRTSSGVISSRPVIWLLVE